MATSAFLKPDPPSPAVQITVLGSGTSSGVPTIGCRCEVCTSTDPRDKRLRPSILLRYSGRNVVIDTGPDFRAQVLRAGIDRLDAIVYTHAHADHILGLDDVRPFNFRQREPIPVYATQATLEVLQRVFQYAFDPEPQSMVPKLDLRVLNGEPFDLFGLSFEPIRLDHGHSAVFGFRLGAAAYLTDHSAIPEESKARLHGLDVLFLDALRYRPHPTHTTVADALKLVEELQPRRVFFTHMCHDLGHTKTEESLPAHVRLAYDGLEIAVDAASVVPAIVRDLSQCAGIGPCALTIGIFDSVHAGHRELLRRTVATARQRGIKAVAMTFHPHPAAVLAPGREPRMLMTLEERCQAILAEGIDHVFVMEFTTAVARLTPEEFVAQYLRDGLEARAVLVGDNFSFGRARSGNTAALERLGPQSGFTTEFLKRVQRRGRIVSSTEIRRAIHSGEVGLAARLLERPYALMGEVVRGHGIGSTQTVPTLNLSPASLDPPAEVLPAPGVYITRTTEAGTTRRWNSITNVGQRPTFGGEGLTIETFLLDPLEASAPSHIKVEFLRRVRDERKFESPEALKAQILRDVSRAHTYFRRCSRWIKSKPRI
jgi:riboflavin kinase/FMN adenylyltransferase